MEIKKNDFINKLSSYSLDIYIIHGNPFIISFIYLELFRVPSYYSSSLLFLHILLTCTGIFIGCIIIGYLRKILFKYTIDRINNRFKLLNAKIDI